jgi:hypothetical protein
MPRNLWLTLDLKKTQLTQLIILFPQDLFQLKEISIKDIKLCTQAKSNVWKTKSSLTLLILGAAAQQITQMSNLL